MMRYLHTLFLIPLSFIFLAVTATADELIMKNGDRLSGTVVSKDGETLQFETEYGGPFEIKWQHVRELRSDSDMTLLHPGGEVQKTRKVDGPHDEDSLNVEAEELRINPEPWRLGEGYRFTGRVNTALQFDRGNTDKDDIGGDLMLELRDLKNRYTLSGEIENEESEGETTTDKWLAHFKYDRFLNKRLYASGYSGIESDRLADLNNRSFIGPAMGYQFYEGDIVNLQGELGAMYVEEDRREEPSNDFWALGWRVAYDHFIIHDALQFYHRHNGIWDVEDTGNLILKAWTGLRAPIISGIAVSTEVKVEYDREPAKDADTTDTTYAVKLGYEW